MAIVSLTGSDVIKVNGTLLTDLADGNCVELTYPNKLAEVKTGKNSNSIYAENKTGLNGEVKLRLVRGSDDDKYLSSLLASQLLDFSAFSLITGQFIKKVGDGQGNVNSYNYQLQGGVFRVIPSAMTNVEGNVEQSVSVYEIQFASVLRNIS
jgi:hypothetical protein